MVFRLFFSGLPGANIFLFYFVYKYTAQHPSNPLDCSTISREKNMGKGTLSSKAGYLDCLFTRPWAMFLVWERCLVGKESGSQNTINRVFLSLTYYSSREVGEGAKRGLGPLIFGTRKTSAFLTDARFAIAFLDGVLGPPSVAQQTVSCPCFFLVPEATYLSSMRILEVCHVISKKSLKVRD